MPLIKKWVERIRKKYRNMITFEFEKLLSATMLFNSIAKWRDTVLTIQRSLRMCLAVRRSVYTVLLDHWNDSESAFFHKKLYKRKKSTKTRQKKSTSSSVSTIPEEIKKLYLNSLIKQKIADYLSQMKKYSMDYHLAELNKMQNEFENTVLEKETEFPVKPERQGLLEVIGKNEFTEMIQAAERDRSNWGRLLEAVNTKVQMSYVYKPHRQRRVHFEDI